MRENKIIKMEAEKKKINKTGDKKNEMEKNKSDGRK